MDLATTWREQRAVWGKSEKAVLDALKNIEASLPFPILGFDCDNGSEFLYWQIHKYLTKRKHPVCYTRSRPYYKNDNAHIEKKTGLLLDNLSVIKDFIKNILLNNCKKKIKKSLL